MYITNFWFFTMSSGKSNQEKRFNIILIFNELLIIQMDCHGKNSTNNEWYVGVNYRKDSR